MLKSLKKILDFRIKGKENEDFIGRVKDVLFDEEKWAVKYLIIETKKWSAEGGRLISPLNIVEIDWVNGFIQVDLLKEQLLLGPKVKLERPVTKIYESEFNQSHKFQDYWNNAYGLEVDGVWGGRYCPYKPIDLPKYNNSYENPAPEDLHMHSLAKILGFHIGYHLHDCFGRLTDFILEEDTWALRYLVIDTHKYWGSEKKILFSPAWIEMIDWNAKKLLTNFHREMIGSCPSFDQEVPIENSIEESLLSHLGRSGDWNLEGWKSLGIDYNSHLKKD